MRLPQPRRPHHAAPAPLPTRRSCAPQLAYQHEQLQKAMATSAQFNQQLGATDEKLSVRAAPEAALRARLSRPSAR